MVLCEPSHIGEFWLCLHPQKKTFLDISALYGTGVKLVPACEPSQKGWLLLKPHEHQ